MIKGKKLYLPITSKNICHAYELLLANGLVSFPLTQEGVGKVEAIVANINNPYFGVEIYETIEEKAVAFLYFLIKDHPFIDGNKRIGAYIFIWFLRQSGILDISRILTPSALTALTLLVAESDPRYKEKMIQLVLTMLVIKNKKK